MASEKVSEDTDLLVEDLAEEYPPSQRLSAQQVKHWLKFVSTEIVVFCFVFVFYCYQYYTEQYLFQWYAIEALQNATSRSFSNLSSTCYNQTVINELTGSNSTINEVEEKAAHTNLLITLAKYVPSLLVNLIISPLSDKYGRKPAMVLVLSGEVLAIMLSVIATYLVLDIYWFILCGFLLGFSGGVSTLMSVSFAYVSDITPQRWRTVHLGFLQAIIYISTAISAGVFNSWLQSTNCDFRPPSWLMLVIVLAGFLYTLVMPESLPKEKRLQLNQSKRGIAVLLQGLKIFFWPRLGYSLWRLWLVALSVFVVVFGESGEHSITTLFLLHRPLEWSRSLIGVYGIARAVSHALALFLLLPLLTFFKCPEPLIVIIGIVPTVSASLFLGFVEYTWEMFLVVVIQGMQSLLLPALLGINSKIVREEDQGALFSILSTFSLLAALLGSIVYSLVYPFTLLQGLPPGSSFWLTAIIWAIPLPFMLFILLCGWRRTLSVTTDANTVEEQEQLEATELEDLTNST